MSLAGDMLQAFGAEAQAAQMAEEAAEFAHAALRVSRQIRTRRMLGIVADVDDHLIERLAEETADLELQIEQARLLVGEERMPAARSKTASRALGILRTAPPRVGPRPGPCALLMWTQLSITMKMAMMDAAETDGRRRVSATRTTEDALRSRGLIDADRWLTTPGDEVREAARCARWPGMG